ncbi:hypothetical protein GDN83_14300 [Gordonia jinghuaiqii]|uniref:Uncharacterized protein n=1 Tax=Gordonia jinghuaiqii TaxID=2758710 RepID=A0A7D7QVC3_9ACTN|nr:hypothetical protein [Gordonia jinghuaiqii]MCR5978889.1 hypothetical protein [Gordonia jinghuaiqii]QMS99647.1 hypothetical protein H1R19_00715 [Gordonia jinghuaiqii]
MAVGISTNRGATMATHASGQSRGALQTPRSTPRANYDVARSCRTIAWTILALLVIIIALALI